MKKITCSEIHHPFLSLITFGLVVLIRVHVTELRQKKSLFPRLLDGVRRWQFLWKGRGGGEGQRRVSDLAEVGTVRKSVHLQ